MELKDIEINNYKIEINTIKQKLYKKTTEFIRNEVNTLNDVLRCEINRERYGESHTESRNTGRDLYGLNEYEICLQKVLDQYDYNVTEVEQEEDLTPYDECMIKVPSIF